MFYQYFSEKKNAQDFVEMQVRLHRKTNKYHVESTPVGSPVEFGIARARQKCDHRLTILCVVVCAIGGFISDQISLSKGDALGF